MTVTERPPDAVIVKARWNPDFRDAIVVEVRCPRCPKRHTHGVGLVARSDGTFGHRVAHCSGHWHSFESRGYYLADPDGKVAELVAARKAP